MSVPGDSLATGSAAAAAAAKKAARRKAASNKEDTSHTWNRQLMEACLACDLTRAKELVECGADPINAREVPPPSFYAGALGVALQEQRQQQLQRKHSAEKRGSVSFVAGDAHEEVYGVAVASATGEGDATDATGARGGAASISEDQLTPLAAMLLSGLDTPAARSIIAFLIGKGASVNDSFSFLATHEEMMDGDAAGTGDEAYINVRSANVESRKGGKKAMSTIALHSEPAAPVAGSAADEVRSGQKGEVRSVDGSVLHYVVSRGDHAQLLRLLLLAGPPSLPPPYTTEERNKNNGGTEGETTVEERFPVLPYSLLNAIEQETVVGALRHQQLSSVAQSTRPTGGGKGGVGADEAATGSPPRGGQHQQKGKGKQGGATTPVASRPVSLNNTGIWTTDSMICSAACTISAASAESIIAAFNQRQQNQRTNAAFAGGGEVLLRQLPVLLSAYPHFMHEESSVLYEAGAPSNTLGAALWSLRQLRDDSLSGVTSLSSQKYEGSTQHSSTTNAVKEESHVNGCGAALKKRSQLDLAQVDSLGCTAATIALHRGDMLSFRLLLFFGAPMPFNSLVNATQTRLARACSRGDVVRVEYLLRHGDRLSQLSADGRFTLIHYAAAQPAVLKVLMDHGLSLETENVWGETAVLSLLRHGTARNDTKYVQTLYGTASVAAQIAAAAAGGATEGASTNTLSHSNSNNTNNNAAAVAANALAPQTVSTTMSNAITFTQLPPSAQRNYILCPPLQLPALTTGGGGNSGSGGNSGRGGAAKERVTSVAGRRISTVPSGAAAANNAASASAAAAAGVGMASNPQPEQPFFGGREAGSWWSFLPPTTSTAEAIDTLLKAGAVLQGYVPDEDLDLPYVRFAESQAAAATAANDGRRNSDDVEYGDEIGDDWNSSRDSLSGSANTAGPTSGQLSGSRRINMVHRPQPFPGRLPLRVTPLQQAILDYHPELIRRLVIDYRVDLMQRDSQGATALHYAALCSHAPSVLELLLSPQVMLMHMKIGGGSGGTGAAVVSAFGAAAGSNANEATISIPAAAGSKIDLNGVDLAGRTPLFYAALVGNERAVKLFLRFGALVHVGRADRDGLTPLHVAVRRQHPVVVELLIRHSKQLLSGTSAVGLGSNLFSGLMGSTRGAADGRQTSATRTGSHGRHSSHRNGFIPSGTRSRRSNSIPSAAAAAAAVGGAAASTEILFANGGVALVDVEAEDRVEHMTPLEMLIKQTQPQVPASAAQMRMATALLSEGQASSLRPSGLPNGGSLLHRVVMDGQVELAELLLSHYADPDEVDDMDETPLFLAVRHALPPPSSSSSVAAEKSDATTSSPESSKQEQQRIRRGRTSLIRILLQYGATPFAQSGINLETPQHLAARSLAVPAEDSEEILQLLFYTAPDRKFASAGTSRRRRSDSRGGKSRENRVLAHMLDAMEAESNQLSNRGSRKTGIVAAAKENALRRRLNRTSSEGNRMCRRHSSLDGNARDRRSLPRQPLRRTVHSPSSPICADGLYGELLTEEQLPLPNSSFASSCNNTSVFDDDDDDHSAGGSRASSREGSTTQRPDNADGETNPLEMEADHQRVLLRQWQCADHLLTPSHCWMLTNSQGQTPLHVLCSSACRAVQGLPAVLRLLTDLQTVTVMRDMTNRITTGDRDVLTIMWGLPDGNGRTPLHAAAQSGFVEAMEIILRMSPSSVVAVDAQGRTPLHACVLMRHDASVHQSFASTTTAAEKEETGESQQREQQQLTARLHGMVSTLRNALSTLTADGKVVQLRGQPIRSTGRDVLPTPFNTAAVLNLADSDGLSGAALEQQRTRAIAALVQPSTITGQLQRWQKTRHWGARALIQGVEEWHKDDAEICMGAAQDEVRSWKAYAQLPDGQGRTALLLAAEVGNRNAARELLRQA